MSSRDAKSELEELDAVFRALAHPARRQILLALQFRGGEVNAGDIAKRFSCSWPTVTRHLRVLEEAELVRVIPRGRERCYQLQRERLRLIVGGWLRWFQES